MQHRKLPDNFIKEIGNVCKKYKIHITDVKITELFESLEKKADKSEPDAPKSPDKKKKIGSIQFKHLKDDNT